MKYRLTNNTQEYNGKTLYQIEAIQDFSSIKKGELGGYIENENNLSQTGNCWIKEYVYVLDNARVEEDAVIKCTCVVRENARVFGRAYIAEESHFQDYKVDISGQAQIYGDAYIYKTHLNITDQAQIYGSPYIAHTTLSMSGNAICSAGNIGGCFEQGHIYLRDNAQVCGGRLEDNCCIYDNAIIYDGGIAGNAQIYGNAKIYDSDIYDDARIAGNVEIRFDTNIAGNAYLCSDSVVERDEDVMTFSNIGTLALLLNKDTQGMQHLSFFRVGNKMQMTIGDHFYDDPEIFLQQMKLIYQNLQTILEMAEQQFSHH